MFIVIYKKSTKHIAQVRTDGSTIPTSAEAWLSVYVRDNKLTVEQAEDLAYVETSTPVENIVIGKHMWDESTQQVEEDPDYVPPTPIAPTEPTE